MDPLFPAESRAKVDLRKAEFASFAFQVELQLFSVAFGQGRRLKLSPAIESVRIAFLEIDDQVQSLLVRNVEFVLLDSRDDSRRDRWIFSCYREFWHRWQNKTAVILPNRAENYVLNLVERVGEIVVRLLGCFRARSVRWFFRFSFSLSLNLGMVLF